jgi:hypothetical protein
LKTSTFFGGLFFESDAPTGSSVNRKSLSKNKHGRQTFRVLPQSIGKQAISFSEAKIDQESLFMVDEHSGLVVLQL